ncbi:MAG: PAS domain S-box protein [Bacillota bacterium]|nr:PAS domain S-box protein [Bacillota bacterium]
MKTDQERFSKLINCLDAGYAFCQFITDKDGNPVDYRILEINKAFENITGLAEEQVIGKKASELSRITGEQDICRVSTFTDDLTNGKKIRTENYFSHNGLWLEITALSDNPGYFAAIFQDISARRQSEADLDYQNKSLEALFKSAPDAMARLDQDYSIIDINRMFTTMFGYKFEEIKGKTIDQVMNMGKPGSANASFTARVINGDYVEEEGIRYNRNGEPIEVLIKGLPICVEGKLAGAFAIYVDISERNKIVEALKFSEEKYRVLAESVGAILWEYDIASDRWTYVSPQVFDILGYKPEDWKDMQFWVNNIHPEDRGWATKYCAECTERGEDHIFEYRFLRKDGSTAWLQDDVKVETVDGKPVRMRGFLVDITEHKEAEEALQRERWRLESIIEGANLGTWEWDLQSGKTLYNKNWAEMLGYRKEELEPMSVKTWEALVHPDDLKKSDDLIARHLAGEIPHYECECRMKHKDGRWIWVHDRGRIITRTPEGKPLLMFGIHSDITERKLAEEKIHYASFHDSLTGLYNRTFLDEELKRLNPTRKLPVSIIMADLNGLKLVNDTYGHSIGDKMLKCSADLIKHTCREEDIIARFGGDEFVILLPQTTMEEAMALCRRIKSNCSNTVIEDVPISMALGVSSKFNQDTDLIAVLREAENVMYKQKLTESRSAKSSVLKALLKTLEAKSFETEAHTRRMQKIAQLIGSRINLTDDELTRLDLLITLHDIGKINIPEDILVKSEPLTEDEWNLIKRHPEIGFRITRATEEFAHVAEDILAHHENWDGSGYPRGLKGRKIPLLARITAIADAHEVMSYGRPYKDPLSPDEVNKEFLRCSGYQFDPDLVDVYLYIQRGVNLNAETL